MDKHPERKRAKGLRSDALKLVLAGIAIVSLAACNQQQASAPPAATASTEEKKAGPAGGHPLSEGVSEDEYGEFVARASEIVDVPVNEIVKSIRLNAQAMLLGKEVYDKNCVACHGEDLKGKPEAHAPDLTDDDWRFSGDDLDSGGLIKHPSDIEWTIRYGVRSGEAYARGVEADMLAFDPQYRNEHDLGDYGKIKTVSTEDIDDLAEYVLQLTGQQSDSAKAARGKDLFLDNAKGNCFDCHTEEATGNPALGSANLTRKDTFLYGSDKASIVESITKGRRGTMPGFGKTLKPEELKAVSVFVFSRALKEPLGALVVGQGAAPAATPTAVRVPR
jgi:cytochrome c oxidase cbb3-type subunit 3